MKRENPRIGMAIVAHASAIVDAMQLDRAAMLRVVKDADKRASRKRRYGKLNDADVQALYVKAQRADILLHARMGMFPSLESLEAAGQLPPMIMMRLSDMTLETALRYAAWSAATQWDAQLGRYALKDATAHERELHRERALASRPAPMPRVEWPSVEWRRAWVSRYAKLDHERRERVAKRAALLADLGLVGADWTAPQRTPDMTDPAAVNRSRERGWELGYAIQRMNDLARQRERISARIGLALCPAAPQTARHP